MEPLGFTPPRIYVLDAVWENPAAARRADRLAQAWPQAEVRTFTFDSFPDIVVEEGLDHPQKMGTLGSVPPPIPILGLFRFDSDEVKRDAERMQDAYRGDGGFPFEKIAGAGAFDFFCSRTQVFNVASPQDIRPNPQHVCRPQWRIHQGTGCPHQCAYCGLGGYILSHVNTEEYIERLGDLLAQNRWQKTWLYDDVMDVPTLEPQLDTLAPIMRFFETTEDQYLIIHTKSDRVDALIEAGAPRNTIVVWSLSGLTQASVLEPGTGTTESRIEAARRCQEAGITVRYKFKPIIPVKNWREEADYTIDLALSRTHPDNLSMTALMWMDVHTMKECLGADVLDPEFVRAAEDAEEEMRESHTGPLPPHMREKIYRHYIACVRDKDADIPLTLSTESADMWKSLATELGTTPADYVCGCGAGATPDLLTLNSNPWHDARVARTWDGRPALG
jgi:hypothetical protein